MVIKGYYQEGRPVKEGGPARIGSNARKLLNDALECPAGKTQPSSTTRHAPDSLAGLCACRAVGIFFWQWFSCVSSILNSPEFSIMSFRTSHKFIALTLTIVFAAACQKAETTESKPVEPAYFPASEVCSYPSAGPGKVFINLSGGKWTLSNPNEPGSAYECVGAKSSVQVLNSGGAVIEVGYAATGVEKGSSLISLTYSATGSGQVPNESTWRNAFANLVDAVSRQGLGAVPPELFRKKLSNLSSYSQPGKAFAENFDVGKGFVSITRESSGSSDIKVYVKIFPDVALKIDG